VEWITFGLQTNIAYYPKIISIGAIVNYTITNNVPVPNGKSNSFYYDDASVSKNISFSATTLGPQSFTTNNPQGLSVVTTYFQKLTT